MATSSSFARYLGRRIVAAVVLALFALSASAQTAYVPSESNLAARKAFQDNKFGIFIHFGVYSMLGDGEWVMQNKNINYAEYAKLAGAFYPAGFDAEEWVTAFRESGARYVCFTSRHHDGFSMFHSNYTDYNIVDATPFGRDIVKELADECERQGLNLHLYYSLIDWYRDDYRPLGRTGLGTGRTTAGQWDDYFRFMNNQIAELLTRYRGIDAIWLDGKWDQDQNPSFDWQFDELYGNIHAINSACLIGNNHHENAIAGEDIQIFERDLPGENTAGYSGQDISTLPLETCTTMNRTWGYRITDQNYKTADDLVRLLVGAAGRNANLLINIGPQPDGRLPQKALSLLKEMGRWTAAYGETIYGTRGGIVPPHPWGVTTMKDNRLFVHILHLQDCALFLPITDRRVTRATLFGDGSDITFRQDENGVIILLPAPPTDVDCVVELCLE